MASDEEEWVNYWEICLKEFRHVDNYCTSKLTEEQLQILVTHCNIHQWSSIVGKHPKLTVDMVKEKIASEPLSEKKLLYYVAWDRLFYPADDKLLKFLVHKNDLAVAWALAENYKESLYSESQLEVIWQEAATSKYLRKLLVNREPQKAPYLTKQMYIEAYTQFGYVEEEFISKNFDSSEEFKNELIFYVKNVYRDIENLEQLPLEWVKELAIASVAKPNSGR